jgi:uncharacterized membrane protein HdeD (DUF308 family)
VDALGCAFWSNSKGPFTLKQNKTGASMESGDYGAQPAPPAFMTQSWQAALLLGVLTVVLGLIVSFHPTGSLNVLAVLIGIILILSGIFQLIRVFDPAEPHRVWLGIAGLLFIVIGVVLIRHLHLTRALIGLVVGITWIVQGLAALIGGIAGGVREGRAWWIAFGAISLIAGIVVTATPESSITVLAVLIGIWTVIMGIFEIIGAFILRRAVRRADATYAGPQDSAIVLLPSILLGQSFLPVSATDRPGLLEQYAHHVQGRERARHSRLG